MTLTLGGGRVRASPQRELRTKGVGGHERDGSEAAQLLQGEGQVGEEFAEGRQAKEVRRSL